MVATTSSPGIGDAAGPTPTPGRRRRGRAILTSGAVGAVVVAIVVVAAGVWSWPSHSYAVRPGPVLDLGQRLHVGGPTSAVTPVHGAYDGLTVGLQPLSLGQRLLHAISGDPATIIPEGALHPSGESDATYQAVQKAAYVDGAQIAAAVAERTLGLQVTATVRGVTVDDVVAHSPAATVLKPGDLITAVDGRPLTSASDLPNAIRGASGHPVTLQIQRPPTTTSQTVTTTPVPTSPGGAAQLGVLVEPPTVDVQLAIPVTDDDHGVAGPSAGLMTGLAIYDELSPVDVAAGRTIAGTGTLDVDGRVGDIGGIEAKARAAAAAGAQLFLAPSDQAAAARRVLGSRIPVIGVATFQQALDALRSATTGTG
jgi:PDZ domain-containing protein